jgi:predicted esterase
VSRPLTRSLVLAALAVLVLASLSAVASGRGRARVDLRILNGSAHVTSVHTSSGDQLLVRGSFSVENTGTATVARFRGWLQLTSLGRRLRIREYRQGALRRGQRVTLSAEAAMPHGPARDGCRRLGSDDLAAPSGATSTGSTTTATGADSTPTAVTPPTTASAPPPPTTASAPASKSTSTSTTTPTTTVASTLTSAPTTTVPVSTVPADPVAFTPNQCFFEPDGRGQYENQANTVTESQASQGDAGGFFTSGYWTVVPPSYDSTNQTAETLLVWMHGCDGSAEADSFYLSNYSTDRPYIVISLNGPEGEGAGPSCWDTGDQSDSQQVLADIASAETHFNVNRRRVIIAGYSSGGDLAYQTIFLHADTFAGILAINTDPVRDNTFNDNLSAAIAGAAWKFPIIQVMHVSDTTYPPSTVQPHLAALQSAGFPVTADDPAGDHYDNDAPDGCDDVTPSTCTSGTDADVARYLTSSIAGDGWQSPAP